MEIQDPEFLEQDEWERERNIANSVGFPHNKSLVPTSHTSATIGDDLLANPGTVFEISTDRGTSYAPISRQQAEQLLEVSNVTGIVAKPYRTIETIYAEALLEIFNIKQVSGDEIAFFKAMGAMRKIAERALKEGGELE